MIEIYYSDGRVVRDAVVQIWEDLHNERGGYVRAFWCATSEADSGSPVIGYCSPGGSHRSIIACAMEVWRNHPRAQIFRNGKQICKRS